MPFVPICDSANHLLATAVLAITLPELAPRVIIIDHWAKRINAQNRKSSEARMHWPVIDDDARFM